MWWFKSKQPKEDERLVKTFSVKVSAYIGSTPRQGTVWIHLFESESGKRRWEAKSNLPLSNLREDVKGYDIYNERIYRWLYGATDIEISSYASAPQDDTVNALRGK